ncbi:MAG TPA: hypothetical protein VGN57_15995 [Pirellulaceae bacterium]|jgi:hypothetical protein|nr:hypothetical protein [Pirellulaceae bacterium]
MTEFEAMASGLALSYVAIVVWYAGRLAWRHGQPGSFGSAIENLRRANPKKFREIVWISRINGAMCSAMTLGFTIASPFVAIFDEEERWYMSISALLAPLLFYLMLRLWFWGIRSSPG